MKVVVAGGTGLLGRHLVHALADGGEEVVVLSRNPRHAREQLPGSVQVLAWRPPEPGPWAAALDGADAVVNLTGASVGTWPWTRRRMEVLRSSRLGPTRTLVDAIGMVPAERRPSVLVNASGSDLYEGRDAAPADESTVPATTFLGQLCLDWEAEARRADSHGMRVVMVRTCLVMASGAPALQRLALPVRLMAGGRIGSGRQWISWIDVADWVGAVLLMLRRSDLEGPVNVAAPDPRTQADFTRALADVLHRPFWFPTPAWPVRLALGQQATLILGSRRVWPARLLDAGYAFERPKLEEALVVALRLGGTPVSG